MIDLASEPGSYARFFAQINGTRFMPEQPGSEDQRSDTPDVAAGELGIGVSVKISHLEADQ